MATTTADHVQAPAQEQTGIWSWITTVDHKRIGVLYGVTALFWFLVGGIEALMIRVQLARPENTFISPDIFNQMFTMHATTMIFLAIMPLSAAFFNFMIPLQIGARDVAFPRLNALSYWVYFFGAIFINLGYFLGGNSAAGWFGYSNLTSIAYSPHSEVALGPLKLMVNGVDFWAIGLQILGIASLAAGFNFIVTIVNMRAPGLKMMRLPPFTWMTLVTSFLIIFAFPVITVALILLMFDRFTGTNFYQPESGADPLLWQHLFWLFGHPEVYILILPAMGVISEILPTFSRKPLFGYPVVVYSGIFIGFMGWGVWSHHMFSVGLGPLADSFFALTTMLIAIPTGVKIFNWIATMWGGRLELKTPMVFAIGFIGLFTMGGLSGFMHASPPADLQQTDTYFVVAHIHYVLFGGSMFGLFAGLYYWFPKITGRMLDEKLGQIHFWSLFVAMNVTFFPMHFVGLLGMPRRVYTYAGNMGFNEMNMLATVGAFGIALSTVVLIWNVMKSLKSGAVAGNDPWGGATLEWATSSPPPVYNFGTVPHVHSLDPLWHKESRDEALASSRVTGHIHMPPNSYWPFVTAIGINMLLGGMIFGWWMGIPGVIIMLVGIYKWAFEPVH